VVGIALPTCEPRIELLEALISSLRAQDHRRWICAICDDHSPADFLGAIRSLVEGDDRFVLWAATERLGAAGNIERILAAMGDSVDLVALADQTDHWHPKKLSRLIAALDRNTPLVSGDVRILGPDRIPLCEGLRAASGELPTTIESLTSARVVPGSGSLLRRELLEIALPFPQWLGLRHDQWLGVAAQGTGEIRFVDEVLTDHVAVDPERALAMIEANSKAARRGPRRRARRGARRVARARVREIEAVLDVRLAAGPTPGPAPVEAEPLRASLRSSNGASPDRAIAISVKGLTKRFHLPPPRPETVGARLVHPIRQFRRDELTALEDVSFEVMQGEFFGIAGGNGSGKTTLLQILANVYRADAGRVLVAPRVASIIALGVGFHQDLPARPNVIAVAELLGVPTEVARRKVDDVIAFAELERFADLRLRNYSSGMKIRLAFATMLLVDADVLLLDEIMAVGDAAFKDKAKHAFDEMLGGKTVVLVTHNMPYLVSFCDRALLLNRGRVELVGDPHDVARRYAELALESHGERTDLPPDMVPEPLPEPSAEIIDLWIADREGEPTLSLPARQKIRLRTTVVASESIGEAGLRFEIRRRGAARMFAPPTVSLGEEGQTLRAGGRLEVETTIENKLAPGAYTAVCTVTSRRDGRERSVSPARTTDFVVVAGASQAQGVVDLEHSVRIRRRGGDGHPTPGADR
jgi:ABC-type polysaccharide/polyol phosphate transport system ATPase subunit